MFVLALSSILPPSKLHCHLWNKPGKNKREFCSNIPTANVLQHVHWCLITVFYNPAEYDMSPHVNVCAHSTETQPNNFSKPPRTSGVK